MSISGLTNSALDSLLSAAQSTQNGQGGLQQLEAEFQQLGQDLQTGNLTQAQEDYTTLSENFQNAQNTTSASTTAANSNPITQAFAALSQSLQSGDLSAAQQDYATLQQDIQQQETGQVHPHHHHGPEGASKTIKSRKPSTPCRPLCNPATWPGPNPRSPRSRRPCSSWAPVEIQVRPTLRIRLRRKATEAT